MSTQVSAVELPLYIKGCNNCCSSAAMQRKAETISSNSAVVVINAQDGIIKAYDVRTSVIDDYIPIGVAYERAVPSGALSAFNKTIESRDAHVNSLKAKFPKLVVPVDNIDAHYGNAANSLSSVVSNNDATAYDFVASSSYRRSLFRLLNDTSHYSNFKANKGVTLDKLSVGFNAKFISLSADLEFFTEKVKLVFSDRSFVTAELNEDGETYNVIEAADASGNDIPAPSTNELSSSNYMFNSATDLLNFKSYVSDYWSVDLSGVGSYQSASCRVTCRAHASSSGHFICTYKCN